jgi:hypothetical protein
VCKFVSSGSRPFRAAAKGAQQGGTRCHCLSSSTFQAGDEWDVYCSEDTNMEHFICVYDICLKVLHQARYCYDICHSLAGG